MTSQLAKQFVEWLCEEFELGLDGEGNPVAVPRLGNRVVYGIQSGSPCLAHEAALDFEETHSSEEGPQLLRRADINAALEHVTRVARRAPARLTVHQRFAFEPDRRRVTIDLGRIDSQCLVITPDGFRVEVPSRSNDLPLFRWAGQAAAELPLPEASQVSLNDFWDLLGLERTASLRATGWVITAPFQGVERPICCLTGDAAVAIAAALLRVLDPRPYLPPLPGLKTMAGGRPGTNALLGYELDGPLTPAAARRLAARQSANNPSGPTTGVLAVTSSPDPADALHGESVVHVALPRSRERQLPPTLMLRSVEAMLPGLMAALAQSISAVLANLPTVRDPDLNTWSGLSDYELLLAAHDAAEGRVDDGLLAAHRRKDENAADADCDTSSRLVDALGQWLRKQPRSGLSDPITTSELLAELNAVRSRDLGDRHHNWPKDADELSVRLRRVKPLLSPSIRMATTRDRLGVTRLAFALQDAVVEGPKSPAARDDSVITATAAPLCFTCPATTVTSAHTALPAEAEAAVVRLRGRVTATAPEVADSGTNSSPVRVLDDRGRLPLAASASLRSGQLEAENEGSAARAPHESAVSPMSRQHDRSGGIARPHHEVCDWAAEQREKLEIGDPDRADDRYWYGPEDDELPLPEDALVEPSVARRAPASDDDFDPADDF